MVEPVTVGEAAAVDAAAPAASPPLAPAAREAPLCASWRLAHVSHLAAADSRIGMPMCFGAAVQGVALFSATAHFRRHPIPQPLARAV